MIETPQQALESIFCAATGFTVSDTDALDHASYADLRMFAGILSNEPSEETLQQFLSENPRFLMGLYGWGEDSVLAFLTKPPVGLQFRADFAILQYGQGGCTVNLIELEPSKENLFTKSGDRSKRHNGALTQARNWMQWIHPNQSTFIKDLFNQIQNLPDPPERALNKSFRRRDYKSIESSWRGFSGFENPQISITIVMGRWSKMSEEHQKALISQNRHDGKLATVITYEQLARSSFERVYRGC